MDAPTAPPAVLPSAAIATVTATVTAPVTAEQADLSPAPDRLGAEVRDSALLLVLSLAVTAGLSAGAQALLSFVG